MAESIFVGSVSVGVVPDARGWNEKLRSELVPSASAVGDEVGSAMGKKITDKMGEAGVKSGGAFEDTFRKRIKAALDALPEDATGPIAELRAKLQALSEEKIIDGDKAVRELIKIDTALEDVKRKSKDIPLSFNTNEARAQLALLRRDIGREGSGAGGQGGGILSGIGGLFGGGGGVAAQGAGQGAQAGGAAASAGGGLFSNPYVAVGAIAAALAALPFIAQAAAGSIVSVFGAAFLGIGILGAAQAKRVQQSFGRLKESAMKDITEIGKPFVPVVLDILQHIHTLMNFMTPVFTNIMKLIAGPFKLFADTIIKAFMQPAVVKSMNDVAKALVAIMKAFAPDIPGIVASFAQAISRVADAVAKNPKAFADFINFIFQFIIMIIDGIAYLTLFADYVEQHFKPAVHDIAVIFDGVRHEVMHILDIMWNDTIAKTIQFGHDWEAWYNRIFRWIVNLWDGFRHEVMHILDIMWNATIAKVIQAGHDVEAWYNRIRQWIINIWNGVRADSARIWDTIWNNTIGRIIRGYHDVQNIYNQLRNWVVSWFGRISNDATNWWNIIWNNTVGRVIRGAHDVENVYTGLKNWILNFFASAGSWLYNIGADIIHGLWQGMVNGAKAGGSFVNDVKNFIIGHIKSVFGISSPATTMIPIGANIIGGIIKGMVSTASGIGTFIKDVFGGINQALGATVEKGFINIARLPGKALSVLGSIGGKIGGFFAHLFGGSTSGGVNRWAGQVAQALGMLGLPVSLSPRVLYQMQTESGGNPNAINLTDINAQMGDPSRGLLQTIGATFSAFHVPGTSFNIYDPLANIAAAINYALHRYGPTLMSGGMGMGSGHGYDTGGWWPPGTFGWNTSGKHELVVTQEQLRAGSHGIGGVQYHAHFDGLTGAAIESHVQTAFKGMSLTQGMLERQGRRR